VEITTRDPMEYMALLNERRFVKLKKQIRRCFDNVDYYRQRFLDAGIDSPDAIASLDDFRRLPAFLDKPRHRESQAQSLERYGHPYGLHLIVPLDEVIHIAATSGRPVIRPSTHSPGEIWTLPWRSWVAPSAPRG
jgi:phenylacetate-CoA ligase